MRAYVVLCALLVPAAAGAQPRKPHGKRAPKAEKKAPATPEPAAPAPSDPADTAAKSPDEPGRAPAAEERERVTVEAVTLRKKPGEKEPAAGQLGPGTHLIVLQIQGRWLLVRANGLEGYLTRTTVNDPTTTAAASTTPEATAAPAPAATTRWSAGRTVDGKLVTELYVDVMTTSGALRADPRPEATEVATLAKGDRLVVVDASTDPAWIHARDKAGHDGWIARADVDNGASSVVVSGVDLQGVGLSREASEDTRVRAQMGKLAIRTDLGVGFRALGMNLTSNAEGGLTNYLLDAEAIAAVLDVDVVMRMSSRFFVAADARLEASDSSPGIDYPGPTSRAGKIPFETIATDLGVRAGIHAKQVFDLSLRLGGHYDAFLAQNVDNVGMLPRERLLGATLGARADIVPPRSRFTITARVDALLYGARSQTPGLEDGTSSTAHAVWAGTTVRFVLSPRLGVFGAYDFEHAETSWTGMSTRQPGVTSTDRVDTAQVVQIGVSAEL